MNPYSLEKCLLKKRRKFQLALNANTSNNVTVIDGATNNAITTIAVGNEPRTLTWNPMQNRTYIANYYSSNISVISDVNSIEENNSDFIKSDNLWATVFNGPMRLPKSKTCRVFDITGREVIPNKISPGIYFIQIDGVISQKVIMVR